MFNFMLFAAGTLDDEEAFYLRHGETRESLKVRLSSVTFGLWRCQCRIQCAGRVHNSNADDACARRLVYGFGRPHCFFFSFFAAAAGWPSGRLVKIHRWWFEGAISSMVAPSCREIRVLELVHCG
jgi:hypothetical protein